MFSVPEERLSAITNVPPLGVRFARRPAYVPLKSTVPPATGEKAPR